MKTEDKLEEAKYFLDKLKKISRTISAESQWEEGRDVYAIKPEFRNNFSACIQALRSVFDFLLYDYAEKYFRYSLNRQWYMNRCMFSKKAEALGLSEPKRFIQWYNEEFEVLKNEHLFSVRVTDVHRGGNWMDTQLKDTYTITKDGIKTEKEIHIAGMPETVTVSKCERLYLLMDEIVKKAREEFG